MLDLNKARCIFLMSHMRSRSSVLAHVLGSNPEINGYYELHRSYLVAEDVMSMQVQMAADLGGEKQGGYFLDKLLHNKHLVSKGLCGIVRPKIIFLLRGGEDSIKSTLNMGDELGYKPMQCPDKMVDYYCARLLHLASFARDVSCEYHFIDSDDLVDNTEESLVGLSEWLQLEQPLNKHYSIFANTGRAVFGDPSANIKSGVVMKTAGYQDVEISEELVNRAELAYTKCKESLLRGAI